MKLKRYAIPRSQRLISGYRCIHKKGGALVFTGILLTSSLTRGSAQHGIASSAGILEVMSLMVRLTTSSRVIWRRDADGG
jgi:hypothetical protein